GSQTAKWLGRAGAARPQTSPNTPLSGGGEQPESPQQEPQEENDNAPLPRGIDGIRDYRDAV
ncbi:MAG: hypothetical protein KGI70_03655, partial [Patescibacteria group bacterium]|nr:hypothetical protein [Patescibacteria group bacterium]